LTALSPLDRLVALEDLRRMQARLYRLASARDWRAVQDLFTPDGQFRVFRADGTLECFADGRGIGETIERVVGEGIFVVRGYGEEIEILSDSRAEINCSVEDLLFAGQTRRVLHGFGSLSLAYRRAEGTWRVRSAEFTRIARERR